MTSVFFSSSRHKWFRDGEIITGKPQVERPSLGSKWRPVERIHDSVVYRPSLHGHCFLRDKEIVRPKKNDRTDKTKDKTKDKIKQK